MDPKAQNSFLSEANIKEHLSYLKTLKNKFSIIEKSYPELKGKSPDRVLKMNLKRQIRSEAFDLLLKIQAHEIFFSSFAREVKPSPAVRKYYSSENSFVYEMKMAALSCEYGYIYVYKDFKNVPRFRLTEALDERFIKDRPLLLVDLYEHAYFADYGFNYKGFLDGALSHLDLSLISR